MKIKIKDKGLGTNNSQPFSIKVNLPKIEEIPKPKIVIPIQKKEEIIKSKQSIQLPTIKEPSKQTYGVIHNEQPVIKQEENKTANKDSVLDFIDTGFGTENTLHKECPPPKWVQYLSKENFLSEFKSDIDKKLARDNLEVYSKKEIDTFISSITNIDASNFVTKDYVDEAIQDLDFVKSKLKANSNYDIPEQLFTI